MLVRWIEFVVGIFMLVAIVALLFLALKVSGLSTAGGWFGQQTYKVTANFGDIGSLKIRTPIRISGVQVGYVSDIELNPTTYQAHVTLTLYDRINHLPEDTSAAITSSGLLGDNYVSLTPGYAQKMLHNGSQIYTTYSATSLQSLISTFLSGSKKP